MINVNDVKMVEGLSAVDEALVRLVLSAHQLKQFREDGDVEVVELAEKVVRRYAEIAREMSPDVSTTVAGVLADAGLTGEAVDYLAGYSYPIDHASTGN